jgi:hypothetical protein
MVFGIAIDPIAVLVGGLTLFALVVFQVLVGLRKIKFGRKHTLYHRYIAYAILGVATVHGLLAIVFLYGIRLF